MLFSLCLKQEYWEECKRILRQGPLHLEQIYQSKLLPGCFTCIRWWWERKNIKICQSCQLNITTQKQVKVLKNTKVTPLPFHPWLCDRCVDDVHHEKALVDSTSPLHFRGLKGAVAFWGRSHYNVLVGMMQFCSAWIQSCAYRPQENLSLPYV